MAEKTASKKTNNHSIAREVVGIITIAFGFLFAISAYSPSGAILLVFFRNIAFGLFGVLGYILPPLTVSSGIIIIVSRQHKVTVSRLILLILTVFFLLSLLLLLSKGSLDFRQNFGGFLADSYNLGAQTQTGGGFWGGIILYPLYALLGAGGSYIMLIAGMLIFIMLITGFSIKQFSVNLSEKIKDTHEKFKDSEQNAEQAYERKPKRKAPTPQTFEPSAVYEPMDEYSFSEDEFGDIDFNYKDNMAADDLHTDFNATKKQAHPVEDEPPFDVAPAQDDAEDLEDIDIYLTHNPVEYDAAQPEYSQDREIVSAPYEMPHPNLLNTSYGGGMSKKEVLKTSQQLDKTLQDFAIDAKIVGAEVGPLVTRYEIQPAPGVKVRKIITLENDIALNLAAESIRIEAPVPGKSVIGIEIPNTETSMVGARDLIDTNEFWTAKSVLTFAVGKDISGNNIYTDLAKMPHLLIAGTTGSGKSVCMNTLILSLLYNASPAQVKLIMVDPKQVEFTVYSGIPHLLVPVVSDPLKAAGALGWAVNEMERRYTLISEQNVRDLDSYNGIAERRADLETMPKVVIFIDELSDLMMVAPSDVEDSIQRLTQKGRAAGIHLVVATQRPSVDVITGVIKSNLPGRIALSVASQIDSRTIINSAGAEQLLGNGDMLFSLNGGNNAVRVQGCYVSDNEVQRVTRFVRDQGQGVAGYDDSVWEEIERNAAMAGSGKKKGGMLAPSDDDGESDDPMLAAAVEVVVDAQMASTTMLQKKLKLGYARASRLVDLLEEKGVVGPPEGSKPRKVLIGKAQWLEIQASGTPAAGLSAVAQTPAKEPTAVPTAMPWGE